MQNISLLMDTFDDPIKPRKSQEYKRVLTVLIHLVPGMSCGHACQSDAFMGVGFYASATHVLSNVSITFLVFVPFLPAG